jgi:hypothetical protein
MTTLIEGMKSETQEISQLASLMYKKLFLDDERSMSLTVDDLENMKASIMNTMDFNTNTI